MTNPLYNSNSPEPYEGPGFADTRSAQLLALVGQDSPLVEHRLMKNRGRFPAGLTGLGQVGSPSGPGGDPSYADGDINRMEEADDSWGSGVFDQPGRAPTANVNMGSFSSSYPLPGFVAREIPFTVSRDISDVTDNAAVVMVPGGGLAYVEAGGRLVPYPVVGPTERPGGRRPPNTPTDRDQPYVTLQSPNPRPTLNQGVPVRAPATFRPARQNPFWTQPVPEQWTRVLPTPAGRRVRSTSDVQPHDANLAVGPMRAPAISGFPLPPTFTRCTGQAAGYGEAPFGARTTPTGDLARHRGGGGTAHDGFGAEGSGPGLGTYIVGGLVVGAAIGFAHSMLKKGK